MNESNTKSVLFIDDEERLLQGLKRMLRPMRKEWDMEFVGSGPAGLQRLKERSFDVIVSDMKMPEVDGATVLQEARDVCPSSIRMVLSGQASEDSVLVAAKVAHQYMAKPCDVEGLKDRISKACRIRDLLGKHEVKTALSSISHVPSIPSCYDEFIQEIESENPVLEKLECLVLQDPGLTAKVLQVTNSAFLGPARSISNPVEAIKSIGVDSLRGLVNQSDALSRCEVRDDLLPMNELADHCQGVLAILERIFTIEEFSEEQKWQARSAGLLHEVGRILLASLLSEDYEQVNRLIADKGVSQRVAEHEVFGVAHPEIGAYLLALWGLPQEIVEAVAFHHNPELLDGNEFNVLSALHLANVIEDELRPRGGFDEKLKLNQDYMDRIGRNTDVVRWIELCEL